ncbi:MAG TPA: hypothetical protein VL987_03035 [Cellvibrio sp.]|jgi:hypothetical protein|nr:hypothetical protein [Cellvibrio sp.]
MNTRSPFIRATRILALGAAACLTLACSPDNESQPSVNNNSPTTANPATQTPPPPTPSSPQTMDDGMNNGMTDENSVSSPASSAPMEDNLDTDRGVGTVPPTTYSD